MFTTKVENSRFVDYYPFSVEYKESNEAQVRRLVERVQKEIEYNWISCYYVDSLSDKLMPLDLEDSGFDLIDEIRFQNGSGLSAWVAKQKRPILLSSVHRGQRFYSNPVKSFVCCPIVRDGETIGVINLGHVRDQAYNKRVLKKLLAILEQEEVVSL